MSGNSIKYKDSPSTHPTMVLVIINKNICEDPLFVKLGEFQEHTYLKI
jgi:hypothetical protein